MVSPLVWHLAPSCFEDWIKRWHKCVAIDWEYFEGDNIDYDEYTCIFNFKNKVVKGFGQGGMKNHTQ